MKIHRVVQGTPEWHELRADHLPASDAPKMMGVDKFHTRNELLQWTKTGVRPEPDDFAKKRFAKGHESEAKARPIAERIVGETLFPVTVTEEIDGLALSASLDGRTMDGKILWENKDWNKETAAAIERGEVHPMHAVQMDQQLLVTKAEKVLFMTSDGTEECTAWMWYEGSGSKIVEGWKQFQKDLETYEIDEAAPVVNGNAPDTLPALRIQVQGMVTDSNLDKFKETALAVIDGISTDLQTDQDFADAEKSVKWCKDVEGSLDAAKQHALSQTETIDALFRAIDEIREKTRSTRLTLEKMVKSRKDEIRSAEVARGMREYREFVKGLAVGMEFDLQGIVPKPQFANVIKGLKTIKSLKDKIDTELAHLKVEATEIANEVRANLATLRKESEGYESLVYDANTLVLKATDDMVAVIRNRIRDAKEREEKAAQAKAQAQAQVDKVVEEYVPPTPSTTLRPPVNKPDGHKRAVPTLDELLSVLAKHFNADRETVLGWITEAVSVHEEN